MRKNINTVSHRSITKNTLNVEFKPVILSRVIIIRSDVENRFRVAERFFFSFHSSRTNNTLQRFHNNGRVRFTHTLYETDYYFVNLFIFITDSNVFLHTRNCI